MFEGYQSRCYIKDEAPAYLDPPKYLADMTLEELAQRWFVIYASQDDTDVNQTLCGEQEAWSDLTLKAFLSGGYGFSSGDVVVILAVEERIRRACEMFAFMLAQHRTFAPSTHLKIEPPTSVLVDFCTPIRLLPADREGLKS